MLLSISYRLLVVLLSYFIFISIFFIFKKISCFITLLFNHQLLLYNVPNDQKPLLSLTQSWNPFTSPSVSLVIFWIPLVISFHMSLKCSWVSHNLTLKEHLLFTLLIGTTISPKKKIVEFMRSQPHTFFMEKKKHCGIYWTNALPINTTESYDWF